MPSQPAAAGHVVVCGLHPEGLHIVEQLRVAGVETVMVDAEPDPRLVGAMAALGVPQVSGDSRVEATLVSAGLEAAAALILVEDDDLHTIETALLARELNPDVRIVGMLANPAVGQALAEVGAMVLDVAALSAPAIVEVCLGSDARPLRLGEVDFVMAETKVARNASLRELFGDLAPVGVMDDDGEVTVAPARDELVVAGQTAVLLGLREDVEAAGLGRRPVVEQHEFIGARAPRPAKQGPGVVRHFFASVDTSIRVTLACLLGLSITSITLLMIGYREPDGTRMNPVDAVYFTVETMGTVGFGDFYFRDQHTWLRMWAILLMILGAALVATFFALVTNALISRRISEALGERRVTGLRDHIVVAGLGTVGVRVVDQLLESGTAMVVVESDANNRFLAHLRRRGVPVVIGDATQPDVLAGARLRTARGVAIVTSDDLANLQTGLAVRDVLGDRWADVPVALRLFDRRLAKRMTGNFGFQHVRSTAALAAPWFVGAALGLEVLSTFYLGDQPMLVARLEISADGDLVGRSMQELSASVRVASLVRPGRDPRQPPRRDTRLEAGDVAYLLGPYEELLTLVRQDSTDPRAATPSGG